MNSNRMTFGRTRFSLGLIGVCAVLLATPISAFAANKAISKNTKLTANLRGTAYFTASNVTLDCDGFDIQYSSSYSYDCGGLGTCGVYANGKKGITIKNCAVHGFVDGPGIYIRNGSGATIDGITSYSNDDQGLLVVGHSTLTVLGSEFWDNENEGIRLELVSGSVFESVLTYSNDGDGIDLSASGSVGHRHNFSYIFAEGNAANGIEDDLSREVSLSYSFAEANGGNGISFDNVYGTGSAFSGGLIENNEANYNLGSGIRIQDCSYFRFYDNLGSSQDEPEYDAYSEDSTTGVYWFGNRFNMCCDDDEQDCDLISAENCSNY